MAINTTVTSVQVLTPDAGLARFTISFFGVRTEEFLLVPGGSKRIDEAFKLEGLQDDGYSSSMFFINEVSEEELQPKRKRSELASLFLEEEE